MHFVFEWGVLINKERCRMAYIGYDVAGLSLTRVSFGIWVLVN